MAKRIRITRSPSFLRWLAVSSLLLVSFPGPAFNRHFRAASPQVYLRCVGPRRWCCASRVPNAAAGHTLGARRSSLKGSVEQGLWEPLLPPDPIDGSGRVLAKLVEATVPLLLRSYNTVEVQVRAKFFDLIRGQVEAVHLAGSDWFSKLRLTARRLDISIAEQGFFDYGALLLGKLQLAQTAHGMAEAVFNAQDFGNFLVYPQVQVAAPSVGGFKLRFLAEGAELDPSARRGIFSAILSERSGPIFFALNAAEDGVPFVSVLDNDANIGEDVVSVLTSFFRSLRVDLAGIGLQFDRLRFDREEGPNGPQDLMRMRLKVAIKRIPNPILDRI